METNTAPIMHKDGKKKLDNKIKIYQYQYKKTPFITSP